MLQKADKIADSPRNLGVSLANSVSHVVRRISFFRTAAKREMFRRHIHIKCLIIIIPSSNIRTLCLKLLAENNCQVLLSQRTEHSISS